MPYIIKTRVKKRRGKWQNWDTSRTKKSAERKLKKHRKDYPELNVRAVKVKKLPRWK